MSPSRRLIIPAAAGFLACAGMAAVPLPAQADDPVASSVVVNGKVAADGTLAMSEAITFAKDAPSQLVQRFDTTEQADGSGNASATARYQTTVSGFTARAGSTALTPVVTTDGDQTVVTIDTSAAGTSPITLAYQVSGAARASAPVAGQPARTEVVWPVLQGLSVAVDEVSGTLTTPGTISYVNCESGPVGRLSPCTTFAGGTHDSPQPSFTDGPRAAGDVVRLDVAVPASVVASNEHITHRWSLDRAFSVNRNTLLASLLPLLLGGALLYLLHRRTGRDQAAAGRITPIAEFTPVGAGESRFTVLDGVRPGHAGTVADERVDPVDVTATLLDLAVRGWLTIVELPREGEHKPLDWRFERREGGEGELLGYETLLRDAVAPAGQPGCAVSEVHERVAPVVPQVQQELYEDVARRGWFDRSPHHTRSRWTTLGWAALAAAIVATVLLVVFTTFGLVGVALTALALGALLVGQEMPRRTADGTALLGGLSSLASQLQTQPTTQVPAGQAYQEISRVLPYAVVLGGRARWMQALADADDDATPDGDDLDWFKAPGEWHLRDLPDSLNSFIVTVQGQLYGR